MKKKAKMMTIQPKTQDGCLAKQRPAFIIDVESGELIDEKIANELYVKPFLEYVRLKTIETINNNKDYIIKVIQEETKVKQPTGIAWKHNIRPDLEDGKKKKILALSRIEKIIQHRIVSELSSYVNNPNPKKEEPTYEALKANIGAADKQICIIDYQVELHKVFVTWKCWTKELLLVFDIPEFIQKYNIQKYCLPSVKYYENTNEIKYDLPFVESLDYSENQFHHCYGAYDDGRVLPYALVFKNHKGAIIAQYAPSGKCKLVNAKRERILKDIRNINEKLAHYDALKLPDDYPKRLKLKTEKERLRAKAKRQGEALARLIGFEIGMRCRFHKAAVCIAENLKWVSAAHGTSRWNYSVRQQWVERECHRVGVGFLTVSPKDSSQTCSACGSKNIVHDSSKRLIKCRKCFYEMDRDFSAARILCSRGIKTYRRYIAKVALSCLRC